MPKFDLTEPSDEQRGAAEPVTAGLFFPALAGSLPLAAAAEEAEEVMFWPVLAALAPDTSDLPDPYTLQRRLATPQCSLGTDCRPRTRWGRCGSCARAL